MCKWPEPPAKAYRSCYLIPITARVQVNTSASSVYGYEVLLGVGSGAYTQASFAVIQAVVEPKDAGAGITLMLIGEFQNFVVLLDISCVHS